MYQDISVNNSVTQTLWPGQPRKLQKVYGQDKRLCGSIVPHTLNALERGEKDKKDLKPVSGIDYYERHIHV